MTRTLVKQLFLGCPVCGLRPDAPYTVPVADTYLVNLISGRAASMSQGTGKSGAHMQNKRLVAILSQALAAFNLDQVTVKI